MSRIRANNIVNGAGTGAPTFPNGAVINGISTITANVQLNTSELTIGTGTTISNPSDNEFRVLTNGSERVRVNSSGEVGIGTNDPTVFKLHLQNSTSALARFERTDGSFAKVDIKAGSSTGNSFLTFSDPDANEVGEINYEHSDNSLRINTNGSERVRITSDGNLKFVTSGTGIDFSAASGSASGSTSALLDDYEEGTFTPGLEGSNTAGSPTFTRNQGAYVKVGRLVTCFVYISMTNKGGMAGDISLTDLPFTVADILPNTGVDGGGLFHYYASIADNDITSITCLPDDLTTKANLYFGKAGVSMGALQDDDINDSLNFRALIIYHA